MKKIMIFGAASAIASETAKCFAKEGAELFLVDLNESRLKSVKDDIIVSGAKTRIEILAFDALDFDGHKQLIEKAIETLNGLDAILIAHGTLPDQKSLNEDPSKIIREFNINGLSVISLASYAANYFENKKSGTIAVISSVAGDRGRQSNYIYGSAKGAVSLFLGGLRNRLNKSNVNVVTIKPGFVDTPMTADIPKNALYASSQKVGELIYKAMKSGTDIAYTPGFWRLVMFMIKHIPEGIFKKLSL
jgi:decaprenylphospho-beta-D-erythro-pentofuranosid-2-ulose 2-reductase